MSFKSSAWLLTIIRKNLCMLFGRCQWNSAGMYFYQLKTIDDLKLEKWGTKTEKIIDNNNYHINNNDRLKQHLLCQKFHEWPKQWSFSLFHITDSWTTPVDSTDNKTDSWIILRHAIVNKPIEIFGCIRLRTNPDNKVQGAKMGPIWVLSAPDVPQVGPMNLAIREILDTRATVA